MAALDAPVLAMTAEVGLGSLAGSVAAIGNFDGVHRGHRALVEAAARLAATLGRAPAALTFEPHPRVFFQPEVPLFRLSCPTLRARWLRAAGAAVVGVLPFDGALASRDAAAFWRLLVDDLDLAGVVVGEDFRFGRGRSGDAGWLAEAGRAAGIPVAIVPGVLDDDGRPISSSAIRAALAAGDVATATRLLGHPWIIRAAVHHGDKRGRVLGYPTANLRMPEGFQLAHGIYAVRVAVDGAVHGGVASFGRRPTFDNGAPLFEVHLFDFAGDLYGQVLEVEVVARQRPEWRFESVEALVRQMDEDSRQARALLAG